MALYESLLGLLFDNWVAYSGVKPIVLRVTGHSLGKLPCRGWAVGGLALLSAALSVLARLFPIFPGDRQLLQAVQGWQPEMLDVAALLVSGLVWWPVSVVWVGLLSGWLFRLGRRRDALMAVLIAVPVGAGFGLKLLVQRLRPGDPFLVQGADVDGFRWLGPDAGGYSFPSGHALFAVLLGGVLVLLAESLVRRWRLRRVLQVAVVLVVLAVGASRVYLGAHWPSDVLGGYLLGVLALWGLMWLRRRFPIGGR